MRIELMQRIAKDMVMQQNLKPNALFPRTFYDLSKDEQAETVRMYKRYKAQSNQKPFNEIK